MKRFNVVVSDFGNRGGVRDQSKILLYGFAILKRIAFDRSSDG